MHGLVGAVLKVAEVKETVLILHFASERKQVYVTQNRLWGRDSVCVVTGLQATRSGIRIPAGTREACLLQIVQTLTKLPWVQFTLEQAMKTQRDTAQRIVVSLPTIRDNRSHLHCSSNPRGCRRTYLLTYLLHGSESFLRS